VYPNRDTCTPAVTRSALRRLTPDGPDSKLQFRPINFMMAEFSQKDGGAWSRRIKPSTKVVSSRLGEVGVLVHLETNRIFELNATGVRIWELAGEGRTLGEIEATLQREFEVTPERLRTELLALVAELAREGMVDDDNPQ